MSDENPRQSVVKALSEAWPGGLTGREAESVLEALQHLVALSPPPRKDRTVPNSPAADGFRALCLQRSRELFRASVGREREQRIAMEAGAAEWEALPNTLAAWAAQILGTIEPRRGGRKGDWSD